MRGMRDEPDQPRDAEKRDRPDPVPAGDLGRPRREPDPLTVALVVFFLGIIAVVAVLLVVPILTR